MIKRDSSVALIKAVNYLMEITDEEREDMRNSAMLTIERLQPQKIYDEMISFYEKVMAEYRNKSATFITKLLC